MYKGQVKGNLIQVYSDTLSSTYFNFEEDELYILFLKKQRFCNYLDNDKDFSDYPFGDKIFWVSGCSYSSKFSKRKLRKLKDNWNGYAINNKRKYIWAAGIISASVLTYNLLKKN